MKKRVLSIVLAVVMLVSVLAVGASAAMYDDTEGHWGEAAINEWTERGIVWGFGDGTFRPDDIMTRAQISQIFTNLLKLEKKADISKFVDLKPNWWYLDVVAKAHNRGIILGTGANTMSPDDGLSREQLMTMYGRALGLEPQATMDKTYSDVGEVASWAIGYVNTLVNKGYINGLNNVGYKDDLAEGILAPKMILTRAMLMQLLANSIGQYITEPGTYTLNEPSEKIVLVVSGGVTLTGNVKNVVVASPEKTEQDKEQPVVTVENATADDITVVTDTKVVFKNSKIGAVKTTGSAAGATIDGDKNSTIGSVTAGADTSVTGDVKVDEVNVDAERPATVQVDTTNPIPTVNLDTDGAAITGSSDIGKVNVNADNTTTGTTGKVQEVNVSTEAGTKPNVTIDSEVTTVTTEGDATVNGTEMGAGDTATARDDGNQNIEIIIDDKQPSTPTGGGGGTYPTYTLTLTIKNEAGDKSVSGTRYQYVDNDVLSEAMYILAGNFDVDGTAPKDLTTPAAWIDNNSKLAQVFGYNDVGDFSASPEYHALIDMVNAYLDKANGTTNATTSWATYVANSTETPAATNEDPAVHLKTVYADGITAKFSELKKGSWDITYTVPGTDPARTYTVTLTIS